MIEGTKTDSLGTTDFPGGMDSFKINQRGAANHMEENGYFTTSGGERYFLPKIFSPTG